MISTPERKRLEAKLSEFQSLIGIRDDFNRRILKPLHYLVFEVQFREPDLRIAFQLQRQARGPVKNG